MTVASCVALAVKVEHLALTGAHVCGEGLLAQRLERRGDVLHGTAGNGAALRRTLTGTVELLAHGRRVVRDPGVVRTIQGIGAIQHHRAQQRGVPQREGLREVGPVGVAVQVDRARAQGLEHRREVVPGQRRAVQRGGRPEEAAAGADVRLGQCILQWLAVDGPRAPGAAVVHDHHVARGAQRLEQAEVFLARLGGREARAALGRDQGARRRGRPGAREILEVDRDLAGHHAAGVQRPLECAAPRGGGGAAMQLDLPHLQHRRAGDRRGGSVHRGGEHQQHQRRTRGPPGSYARHGYRSLYLHCAPGRGQRI